MRVKRETCLLVPAVRGEEMGLPVWMSLRRASPSIAPRDRSSAPPPTALLAVHRSAAADIAY
jgi:hypothetical protein